MAGVCCKEPLSFDKYQIKSSRFDCGAICGTTFFLCGKFTATGAYYLDGDLCGVADGDKTNVFGKGKSCAISHCSVFGNFGFYDYDGKFGCIGGDTTRVFDWLCGESPRASAD